MSARFAWGLLLSFTLVGTGCSGPSAADLRDAAEKERLAAERLRGVAAEDKQSAEELRSPEAAWRPWLIPEVLLI